MVIFYEILLENSRTPKPKFDKTEFEQKYNNQINSYNAKFQQFDEIRKNKEVRGLTFRPKISKNSQKITNNSLWKNQKEFTKR